MKKQILIESLIKALTMAIDLIDQYEAPQKAICGKSSVTRDTCNKVLQIAKIYMADVAAQRRHYIRT